MITISLTTFMWLGCVFMLCPTRFEANFNGTKWIKDILADVYHKKARCLKTVLEEVKLNCKIFPI